MGKQFRWLWENMDRPYRRRHTTTLGIRRQDMSRYVLERRTETVTTAFGDIRIKRAAGMGVERSKPEYDDVAALARKHGVSLETIRKGLT